MQTHLFKSAAPLLVLAFCLLGCGDGSDDPYGSISVSPAEIAAGSGMGTYELSVQAGGAWSASVTSSDSSDADWLTLSSLKGTGDKTVTIRVFQNTYSTMRKADVKFSSGSSSATVTVSQKGVQGGEAKSEFTMTAGTFNLRRAALDENNAHSWTAGRNASAVAAIKAQGYDVFGLQELDPTMESYLEKNLPEYTFVYFNPYSKDGKGDLNKSQGIAFKTDIFSSESGHFFWAADNYAAMPSSANDAGDSGNFYRGGYCMTLRHKSTGVRFFFMNTHACLNASPNAQYAPVYQKVEATYNSEGLPSLFVGDFNANISSTSYATYTKYWTDSREALQSSQISGPVGTFNNWGSSNDSNTLKRIDFVFFRNAGVTVQSYKCDNTLYNNQYPSDHYPVSVTVKISS